jgi:hypothetical protein
MAHTSNPNYSGGGEWEDCGLRPAQAKSYQGNISTNKPVIVVHICYSSCEGSMGRRIIV